MSRIATWTAGNSAADRATIDHILTTLGIAHRWVEHPPGAGDDPLLAYGDIEPSARTLVIVPDPATSPFPPADSMTALDPVFPFDVVRAVGAHLRDDTNRGVVHDARDRRGRIQYDSAAATVAGRGDEPVADELIASVGRWIEARLGIRGLDRWPGGARLAVGLSHDIDHPDRFPTLRLLARRPATIRRAPRTLARRLRSDLGSVRGGARPGDFWVFERLVESQARRGFRSTWFFAAASVGAPWGTTLDVAYDVTDRRFRPVFDLLSASGNEVGLHTSYRAHEDQRRILLERRRLADAARTEVTGNRHHYWQLGPDEAATLRGHDAAGFRYDSSVAFNDHVGFRRATSLPFHPFDETLAAPLRLRELPVFAMDGNLFYGSSDVDAALATIEAGLDRIERVNGMAIFDWHLQACVPTGSKYDPWAEAWQALLDLLAVRPATWVADLGSIDRWEAGRAVELARLAADPAPQRG